MPVLTERIQKWDQLESFRFTYRENCAQRRLEEKKISVEETVTPEKLESKSEEIELAESTLRKIFRKISPFPPTQNPNIISSRQPWLPA